MEQFRGRGSCRRTTQQALIQNEEGFACSAGGVEALARRDHPCGEGPIKSANVIRRLVFKSFLSPQRTRSVKFTSTVRSRWPKPL